MTTDKLYIQNIESYTEHLNAHIYKILQKGVSKLPKVGVYYFPDMVASEWYSIITKNSEFFGLLQHVFKVRVNEYEGFISYTRPLRNKYDEAILAIARHVEESDQMYKTIYGLSEAKNATKQKV